MHLLPLHTGTLLMQRIQELAAISESTQGLTRRFATDEHRRANDLVAHWMAEAGMSVYEDAIGNVIGRYEGSEPGAPAIMLGSHLDTVIMAGKFDGMLGVLCGLACVEHLAAKKQRLRYAIEVIGFADEEGVRYQTSFLGSRAVTAEFDMEQLDRPDKDGISMREALLAFGKNPDELASAARCPEDIAAYLEVHIEQGPVLEQENLGVGVVNAIAGATRLLATIRGEAGHAGTVPMSMRHDALVAAAECIAGVETLCTGSADLVGTVGSIRVEPGASNVIPETVEFTIDIRAAEDARRNEAVHAVREHMSQICARRQLNLTIETIQEETCEVCDAGVMEHISAAIAQCQPRVRVLASGAGHDAMVMAHMTAVGLIFVRCAGGISHNPAESISTEDGLLGAEVMLQSVLNLAGANASVSH
ncbi:MAG: allantoate amidohydrolase [Granulosicoccus sp.]